MFKYFLTNKKVNTLLVLTVLLLLVSFFSFSSLADSDLQKLVDDDIFETLESEQEVRIVVELKDPEELIDLNEDDKKELIQEVQEELIMDLEDEGVEILTLEEDKNLSIKSELGSLSEGDLDQRLSKESGHFSSYSSSSDEEVLIEVQEEIELLKESDVEVNQQYELVNALSLTVNNEESLDEILKNDLVESVYLDYPVSFNLDTSVSQIGADVMWDYSLNNTNITGVGETVCVIDTGVDYTHDALGACNPVSYSLSGDVEVLGSNVESNHNYANNFDQTWTITKPGYDNIAVHFTNISLETPGFFDTTDRVYLYDSDNNTVAVYKGVTSDIWSPHVSGDTIKVRLVTDGSVVDYGFQIDQVINGTTNTTMNWSSCDKVIGGYDLTNNDNNPMDDNDHGTHVAGIISSDNGTYRGVAPSSKIIAIKALDSAGDGYSSDVAAGIDWCVSNSEEYNISVISLSLGCDGVSCTHYQTYCNNDLTSESINNAREKEIMVAIAAGNLGWTDGISNPSCVQNATPVGAVNSVDQIAYNRGDLLQFLAPGVSIFSTVVGGWQSKSGTSMSTPHFSGAAALMKQYWRMVHNTDITVEEIEERFSITSTIIDDISNSGNNYERINVYDSFLPSISFNGETPDNDSSIMLENLPLVINMTSDLGLNNAILEFDSVNYSMNLSNDTTFYYSFPNLSTGDYSYKVYGNDSILISETESRTLSIVGGPDLSINSPDSDSYHNANFYVNVSISGFFNNLSYSNYSITNSTDETVLSNDSGIINQVNFSWYDLINISDLSDGDYNLSVYVNDSAGDEINTNLGFVVDTVSPIINSANISGSGSYLKNDSINFTVNISDLNMGSEDVEIIFNVSDELTNYSLNTSDQIVYIYTSSEGQFENQDLVYYQFSISDLAGNTNVSSVFNFSISNQNISLVNITYPTDNLVIELGNWSLFNATASDPDDDVLNYTWIWGDGSADSVGQTVNKTFITGGTKNVTISVIDNYGSEVNDTIIVIVNDTTSPVFDDVDYDDEVHIESESSQTVSVDATDYTGFSSIKLYFNGSNLTPVSESEGYARWDWDDFSTDGSYSFVIELIDNSTHLNSVNNTYNFTVVSCDDDIDNGDETGVDCGGSCVASCSSSSSGSSGSSSSSGGGGGPIVTTEPNEVVTSNQFFGGLSSQESATEIDESVSTSSGSSSGSSSSSSDKEVVVAEDISPIEGSDPEPVNTFFKPGISKEVQEVVFETDKLTNVEFENSLISIKAIGVTSNNSVTTEVSVDSYLNAPNNLPEIEGSYQYLDVHFSNLSNDYILAAQIEFVIEKDWLRDNGFSDQNVILSVYEDGSWKDLPTRKISNDGGLVIFQADVEHFSYFVISASINKNVFTETTTFLNNLFLFSSLNKKQNMLVLLILLASILGLLYVVINPKGR